MYGNIAKRYFIFSPVWSSSLSKDILLIESVQRKFTKRIPSMSGLTYYSRLQVLGLESLEIKRLRTDVLLVYGIMFGMVPIVMSFSP